MAFETPWAREIVIEHVRGVYFPDSYLPVNEYSFAGRLPNLAFVCLRAGKARIRSKSWRIEAEEGLDAFERGAMEAILS